MKHYNARLFIRLLCALAFSLCLSLMAVFPAVAGEFGATFNYRLTCEYSSWHEGKVVGVGDKEITIALLRDLLRRTPNKTVKIGIYTRENSLKKGDLVLINCWTKPKKIDWTKFPNSFPFKPHFMGKIDSDRKQVGKGQGYRSRMLTWFYRTGRWDARVTSSRTKSFNGYAWYAALPNGNPYLIYDESNSKRPSEFPAGCSPTAVRRSGQSQRKANGR